MKRIFWCYIYDTYYYLEWNYYQEILFSSIMSRLRRWRNNKNGFNAIWEKLSNSSWQEKLYHIIEILKRKWTTVWGSVMLSSCPEVDSSELDRWYHRASTAFSDLWNSDQRHLRTTFCSKFTYTPLWAGECYIHIIGLSSECTIQRWSEAGNLSASIKTKGPKQLKFVVWSTF